MEVERIEMQVNQALPILAKILRFTFWASTFNHASSWIYTKANKDRIVTSSKGFYQRDLNIMNESLWMIGEKLLHTRITPEGNEGGYTYAEGQTYKEQLKSLSKVVPIPYIIERLEKNERWFGNRAGTAGRCKFKEEEIAQINLIILEVANKLLSVKLIL